MSSSEGLAEVDSVLGKFGNFLTVSGVSKTINAGEVSPAFEVFLDPGAKV